MSRVAVAASVAGALCVVWVVAGLPMGLLLLLALLYDRRSLEAWCRERAERPDTASRDEVALTPLRLQAIADMARAVDTLHDLTLFRFLASCKKVSYESLRSLMLVDVDSKALKKKLEEGHQDFVQVRRDFLRNMAKKLTHPLFGITPSKATEEKFRGCEIVEWLSSNFGLQRSHAVEIGRAMHSAGMIQPMKRLYKSNPGKRVHFGDKMRHWRFDMAAIDKDWPAQRAALKNKHSNRNSLDATALALGGAGASVPSLSSSHLAPLPEEEKGFGDSLIMGPREWNYLFAAGTVESHPEGHEILAAGNANDALYRIVKGSVRIAEVDKKKKTLGEEGVFGEESATYLTGSNICNVSVTSVTPVTLQVLDSATLAKLLKIEPVVCKAFFRWLAVSLSVATPLQHALTEAPVALPARSHGSMSVFRLGDLSDQDSAAARLCMYFPEWSNMAGGPHSIRSTAKMLLPRTRASMQADSFAAASSGNHSLAGSSFSSGGGGSGGSGGGEAAASLLIKHFNVRWLSSRSQLFVTPKGVGVVSTVYRSLFRQLVSYGLMQQVEQVVQPNRRNGFDFVLTISFKKTSGSVEKGKSKKKELVLLFEDSDKMRNAFELIEHLRKNATADESSANLTGGSNASSHNSSNHNSNNSNDAAAATPFHDFDVTAEDWQRLTEKASVRSFAKGVCVAIAGGAVSCLFQISSGQVRVVSHGAVIDSVYSNLGEGDLIGDTDFVLQQSHSFTYIAETDVECLALDTESLRLLFVQDAHLGGRFFRFLAMGYKKE